MSTRTTGSIVRVFLDADMRCSQPGLSALALKHKFKVEELGHGEFLIFINSKRNKLKLYAGGDVLAYYRMAKGERLDMRVIQKIPRAFMGTGKLNYTEELRTVIREELARRHLSPLEVAKATA